MKVEVDLDAIAEAQIRNLEKAYTKAQRKIEKLEREVAELRNTRKQVARALGRIQAFASDLPSWDRDWA